MDGSIIAAFISVGALLLIQIVVTAFLVGKMYQNMVESCRRLDRIEKILNGRQRG